MTKPVSNSIKRKEASCEAILDAAEDLLARYGYKRMTMEDLAQAVGLSKGALYLRFTSKEEVALSMIDRMNRRLRVRLEHVLDQPHGAEDKVIALLVERVMFKYDSVKKYFASFDEVYAALRPEILKRREEYLIEESKILALAIERGIAVRAFKCEDPYQAASMLVLASNALLPYRLSPSELGKRKELQERAEQLAAFLVQALSPNNVPQDELYGVKN